MTRKLTMIPTAFFILCAVGFLYTFFSTAVYRYHRQRRQSEVRFILRQTQAEL